MCVCVRVDTVYLQHVTMSSPALLVEAGSVLNVYRFNSGRGVELRMDKRNRTTTAGRGG